MTKPTQTPLASVTSSLQSLSARAKNLREKMAGLNGEIRALREAPVSLEDFSKYLKNWIKRVGENYEKDLWIHAMNQPIAGRQGGMNKTSFQELETVSSSPMFWPFPDQSVVYQGRGMPIAGFCFFTPEAVFEKLFAAIQNTVGKQWGNADLTPIAQRISMIETLNAEIEVILPQLNAAESEIEKMSSLLADAAN